jgi:hypothetical protein
MPARCYHASTLPLSEEGILHHSKFIFEELKLPFNQGFGQNKCNLLICGNMLKLHCSLLGPISDKVVSNMLGTIMEQWILREFDTTMIITIYHHRLQHLINKPVSNFRSQMTSQLDIIFAMYYFSFEMSATKVCFLLNQVITTDPKMKKHPKVIFLSTALPSQYESEYSYNSTPSLPRYLNPYFNVPLKYLSTCFTTIHCTYLESTMN